MNTTTMQTKKTDRLLSLDALRGFDMFWITGGAGVFILIGKIIGADWLVVQMGHVKWAGFQGLDLVFPLFMFLSGIAIPFAIHSKLENGYSKKLLVAKALKRLIILIVAGLVFNEALRGDFTNIRFASVLGQIGIAYFIAATISIYFTTLKSLLYWISGIMAGIAFIQLLIPAPGFSAGELTLEGSINGYIDRLFLPGRLYTGFSDPEGILNNISAAAITLMGVVAGYFLRDKNRLQWDNVKLLATTGAIMVVLALVIHPFYPMIKNCWTSTFNLMAGGVSFMLMALFYMLIDVLKWQKWSFYFRIIGMNSIFIYLFARCVDISRPVSFLFGWTAVFFPDSNQLITSILYMVCFWLILYVMYKKNIFLKV